MDQCHGRPVYGVARSVSATVDQIRQWCLRGLEEGATHLLVKCDGWPTLDVDCCYPLLAFSEESARLLANSRDRTMEVYNLKMDIEQQLAQYRVFNF